jgi:HD-like signal output (HDOD) protein
MNQAHTEAARLLLRENAVMLSLPELCVKLRRILEDPEHSRKDIAAVLRYDPALTARLLRIVNSPYYGLPYRVASISQALGILGEQELQNLVLATSLMSLSRALDTRMDITRFWKTSVYMAVLARNLCPTQLPGSREECFIAGLLLNVGKLPLYCKEPTLLAAVDGEMAKRGCDEQAAERALTGTDHALVGALLAESWNFPAQLQDLIASHHDYVIPPQQPLHTIVRLAGYFGDWHEQHQGQQLSPNSRELRECPWSLAPLGIEAPQFWDSLQRSHGEHLEVHELFCGDLH